MTLTSLVVAFRQPREALLKYADAAEADPQWASSWATQPKVFRNIEDEPEEDPRLKNAPKGKGLDRKEWK